MRAVVGGGGGDASMVVTEVDEKGRERYFEYEETMRIWDNEMMRYWEWERRYEVVTRL
jgi:hypothetical protein